MGIKRLSVTPHAIPELKEVIRSIDMRQAREIAAHALSLDLARDVENHLRGELKKICPDLVL
jgi:phosphotransferase system enzyme I (PtsI)